MDIIATSNLNADVIPTAVNNGDFGCYGPCWNLSDVSLPRPFIIHKFEPTGYSLLNYAPYRLWFLMIDFTLLVPTLFGNILILIALIRYKVLRKIKGFILIGNLAISDLLVGLIFLPMDISLHLMDSLLDNGTYCICYYSILYTLLTASVLNLLLLSVERYHAIIRPYMHDTRFTTKRLCILICATWMIVVAVGCLPVFGWRPYRVEHDRVCERSVLFSGFYRKIMNIIIISALTVCFVCFIAVIRVALRKAKETKRNTVTNVYLNGSSLKRNLDYTKLLLIVSGIFIVCWGPFCIISLFPNSTVTVLYIKNFLTSLGLVNSCLNWIVYGAKNRKFRAAFKDTLTRACWRGDVTVNSIRVEKMTSSTLCE